MKTPKEIDLLIRSGNVSEARLVLESYLTPHTRKTLKETDFVTYTNLARRAGLPSLGVLLLNPVIRPADKKKYREPTDAEKAEYAACLHQIGVNQEAEELLKQVNTKTSPQALLFRAFLLFARWEYESSIPILKSYIAMLDPKSYEYIVGLVNLVDALEVAEAPEFEELLSKALEITAIKNHVFLHGVLTRIAARASVSREDYKKAQVLLDRSWKSLSDVHTPEGLFVKKWRAILNLRLKGKRSNVREEFNAVIDEARGARHWETLREMDFHWALVTGDKDFLCKVYFGTPHSSYRQKILKYFPKFDEVEWSWPLKEGSHSKEFDLKTQYKKGLKVGQVVDRTLCALISDMYRPFRITELHSHLFQGDYWNPQSGPNRVHQALFRVREWISESKLPLELEESNGFIALKASKPLTVKLHLSSDVQDPKERRVHEAMDGKTEGMTSHELAKKMGVSLRTAQRYLKERKS